MENAGAAVADLCSARNIPALRPRRVSRDCCAVRQRQQWRRWVCCGTAASAGAPIYDSDIVCGTRRAKRRCGAEFSAVARCRRPDIVVDSERLRGSSIAETCRDADVILDAMLGTGLRGGRCFWRRHCKNDELNIFSQKAQSAEPATDCGDGHPLRDCLRRRSCRRSVAVRAHRRSRLLRRNWGNCSHQNASACGDLIVRAIGSPAKLVEEIGKGSRSLGSGAEEFARLPLLRPADSHKGLYGNVLIVAGSAGKSGAAVLAGTAALKAGAGLVTVADADTVQPIVAAEQPEYMTERAAETIRTARSRIDDSTSRLRERLLKAKPFWQSGRGLGRLRARRSSFARSCSRRNCRQFSMRMA